MPISRVFQKRERESQKEPHVARWRQTPDVFYFSGELSFLQHDLLYLRWLGKSQGSLRIPQLNKYPELVASDRVHFVVLACEEGGRWGPDVFAVMRDLVRLKVAPLHPLLRRSAALAYTRRWWSILAMGAQSAAIDCVLGQDPQVWLPQTAPPLASVLAWADVAPEPSRVV